MEYKPVEKKSRIMNGKSSNQTINKTNTKKGII